MAASIRSNRERAPRLGPRHGAGRGSGRAHAPRGPRHHARDLGADRPGGARRHHRARRLDGRRGRRRVLRADRGGDLGRAHRREHRVRPRTVVRAAHRALATRKADRRGQLGAGAALPRPPRRARRVHLAVPAGAALPHPADGGDEHHALPQVHGVDGAGLRDLGLRLRDGRLARCGQLPGAEPRAALGRLPVRGRHRGVPARGVGRQEAHRPRGGEAHGGGLRRGAAATRPRTPTCATPSARSPSAATTKGRTPTHPTPRTAIRTARRATSRRASRRRSAPPTPGRSRSASSAQRGPRP